MANVGFATLSVIPVVKGIRGELDRQISAPLVASGRTAGRDAGEAIAAGIASAESKVKAASEKLAKARDKEADSAGRVRVAEEKLQELRDRGVSGSRLVAAEEAYQRAQRQSAQATEATRREVESLTEARAGLANATQRTEQGMSGSGERSGKNFIKGFDGLLRGGGASQILDSVKAIPIAGAFLGIGIGAAAVFIGAVKDGLSTEATRDLFAARTGLDDGTARKFATAAGEAYVNVFGESVQDNLDTLEFALKGEIIDPKATQGEAEEAIKYIQTVADVTRGTTEDTSRAISQMLRTGLADDFSSAADLIVRASQLGLDKSGDLFDTVNEYSTQFRKLGISGAEAVGLINQAVRNGARDSDLAADAIKEFAVRVTDLGNQDAAQAFQDLNLSASEMGEAFNTGGDTARDALRKVFAALKSLESPTLRNKVALELFGSQYEDLGQALNSLDLDTAVSTLGEFQGAATNAANTIGANGASSIEGAMRSIEQASTDVKGALAQAFGPQIKEFGDYISGHREEIVDFFFKIGNGFITATEYLIKFGIYGLKAVAAVTDGIAMIAPAAYMAAAALAASTGHFALAKELWDKSDTIGDTLHAAADSARGMADTLENTAIPALEHTRDTFNGMHASAAATAAVSDALKTLGADTDVTQGEVDALARAMNDEALSMAKSGDSAEDIATRHQELVGTLRGVLTQAGLTEAQINTYIERLEKIPDTVNTQLQIDEIIRKQDNNDFTDYSNGGAVPPARTGSGIGRTSGARPANAGAGIGDADAYGLNGTQRTFWEKFSAQFPEATISDAGIRTWDDGTNGASYHYSGQALDIAGPNLSAYDSWIAANDPSATELFYDGGTNLKDGAATGAIGGHGDHVHYVPSGAASYDGTAAGGSADASGGSADGSSSGGSSGGSGGGGSSFDFVGAFLKPQIDDIFNVFGFNGMPRILDQALSGGSGGGGGGSSSGGSSSDATTTTGGASSTSTTPSGQNYGTGSNQAILQTAAAKYGWDTGPEWDAFNSLEMSEAGYNNTAQNPTSTAYGMGQFLDTTWAGYGEKTSDPALQSQYMTQYVKDRYGTPSKAWEFHQANNWYHTGGTVRGHGDVGAVLEGGEEVIRNGPAQRHRAELKDINSGMAPRRGVVINQYIKGQDAHEVGRAVIGQVGRANSRLKALPIG